jgi:two-component system NtrC family sensor kinase
MESQQLAERQLLITARLAALGEMAAGVAHELNNPLTTVTGFVELALDELPEDLPQREELNLVLSEAQRARGVVRRLLDFARQGENLRTSTDVNDLISTVMSLMQHQAQSAGVQIRLEIWNGLPPIMIDANQIKQVLVNLIQNAIQAMPHGGSLVLSTACHTENDEKWITITVSDTGEGIAPENLERVFDPFFTTKANGIGLGLAIAREIILAHHGEIHVRSKEGKGTTFEILLQGSPGKT